LLVLGEHKYADPFRESVFLRHVPPIPSQPGAKRAPRQTDREPWALTLGFILLTYCTNEPISARIAAILHRLLHGGVAALFLSSDSSYLCNCRKTSHAMTHCLTTNTKNDAEYFQGNQYGSPRAFTDDNFLLEKSGWIKKTGRKRWQK